MVLTAFVIVSRWPEISEATLERLALTWSPTPFYLWALWSLSRLFRNLWLRGADLSLAMAGALVRIGWGLLLGAATALAASPFLLALAGSQRMEGRFATLNVPALTIGVVGLAMLATAHMVRRGAAFEAEATELRAELGEFV
jgi:hypothetical protein